jgi:hypothetical protein
MTPDQADPEAEATQPVDLRPLLEEPPKKARGPMPKQLRPGYRTPEQLVTLLERDDRAAGLLQEFRFASPWALYRLAYADLPWFDETSFKSRMAKMTSTGMWHCKRLGSRPESAVYLSRKGQETYESSYGGHAPTTFNVDTARRGWLRSWIWSEVVTRAGTVTSGLKLLQADAARLDVQGYLSSPTASRSAEGLDVIRMVKDAAAGTLKVAHDYVRGTLSSDKRIWLLVEDPHRSIETQVAELAAYVDGLASVMTRSKTVIFRPVDEISLWNKGKSEWKPRSGRTAKAVSLLKAAGFDLGTAPLRHLQERE